ncbi:MAG: cation-translocating P-type ATPase [Acidimicrobiia bacterium]
MPVAMELGLTSAEAASRLTRDGPNALPPPPQSPAVLEFARQLVHFFAIMLWVAAVLAFVAGLPQLSVAIAVVVVVNGTFAFVQEYRAEHAVRALRALIPQRVIARRDGHRTLVDVADLVRGDVILLEAGDRVPADATVERAHALAVDMSTLTGESVPVAVGSAAAVYAGTFVTEGEAICVVTATGAATRLAGIAALTRSAHRPRSPLARELARVVRTISWIAISIGAVFLVAEVLLGRSFSEGAIVAIGVTVALVPEGLLPTVTLSLALGAQRMAQRNALMRRLEAVEALGSTTFVCTDKTGTLTLNEMEVVSIWTPAGTATITGDGYAPTGLVEFSGPPVAKAAAECASAARAVSTGHIVERDGMWVALGDPMEAAIDALAQRLDAPLIAGDMHRRFPFDPRRRRMSVVIDDEVLVKGAPDAVVDRCRDIDAAHAALVAMTSQGLRVLAVARRSVLGAVPSSAEEAERDLELLGLLGLEDPPRPGARDAIAACRRAGVRVAMVTGDHPLTAAAIARETGLWVEGAPVFEGADLPADDDELGALVDHDGLVLARVDPADKLRVARALRTRGHVVGMTGDGVNDGPALREADIGIAMGARGTDVAREAADLVLLDDDFATIVAAIEQGRSTFTNIRKFLTYHLSANVAELTPFAVLALSAGHFPLALGVLQILALDVVTDTLAAVALGADPPAPHTLERPPVRGRLLNRLVAWRAFGVLGPTESLMSMLAFMVALFSFGWRFGAPSPSAAVLVACSGATFAAIVIGQSANAFACRSATRSPGKLGWTSNRLLLGAVAADLAIAALLLFVPPLASALKQAPPPVVAGAVAMCTAPVLFAADRVDKYFRTRRP